MPGPFRFGVASFDPTSTGVLLWTRVTRPGGCLEHGTSRDVGVARVRWVVSTDAALRDIVAEGDTATEGSAAMTAGGSHGSDGSEGSDGDRSMVVVEVDGLEPATTYFFAFETAGQRSPVGRTRTLPVTSIGSESLRLGLVCCALYSEAPFAVYRALADREVDLVVHLGDYVYETPGTEGVRPHEPSTTAVSLDDYRKRYAQCRSDPDCQALHLRHPMIGDRDDHDFSDNAGRDGAHGHDPARDGPWSARVAAAARLGPSGSPAGSRTQASRRTPTDVRTPRVRRPSPGGRSRSATWPSCCCSTPASLDATRKPAATEPRRSTTRRARCSETINERGCTRGWKHLRHHGW